MSQNLPLLVLLSSLALLSQNSFCCLLQTLLNSLSLVILSSISWASVGYLLPLLAACLNKTLALLQDLLNHFFGLPFYPGGR